MAARLVAGNDHAAVDILGNAFKMAVREQAVSSPNAALHKTVAPQLYQPNRGGIHQPPTHGQEFYQSATGVPSSNHHSAAGAPSLYHQPVTGVLGLYQNLRQRSSAFPDSYNNQPSFGYQIHNRAQPISNRHLEASECIYSPRFSDGGSWSSLSRSRNSSVSQLTPERYSFPQERSIYPPERASYLPEGSTYFPRMSANPPPTKEKSSPSLPPGFQRLDELMNRAEGLHISNDQAAARFGSTLGNFGAAILDSLKNSST